MWKHNYCCCAIPLYQAGIILVALEVLALFAVVGGLQVGGPSLLATYGVGSHAGPIISGIVALVVAVIQLITLYTILGERAKLGKLTSILTSIGMLIVSIISVVWFAVSCAKQNTTQDHCIDMIWQTTAFQLTGNAQDIITKICKGVTWAQIGLLGLLWLILTLTEAYFLRKLWTYNSQQISDETDYDMVANGPSHAAHYPQASHGSWVGGYNNGYNSNDNWNPSVNKDLPVISSDVPLKDDMSEEHIEMEPYPQSHNPNQYSTHDAYPMGHSNHGYRQDTNGSYNNYPYNNAYNNHSSSTAELMPNPQYSSSGFVNDYYPNTNHASSYAPQNTHNVYHGYDYGYQDYGHNPYTARH